MPFSNVDRILYASRSLVTGPIFHEMESIRDSAVRNNLAEGVFTTLLYQAGWFLQWKEGRAEALQTVMKRVSGDARHGALRIVHHSKGPRLLPEPWSMVTVQSDDTPQLFQKRLIQLEEERQGGLHYSPPAVWRRLSTPSTHPGVWLQHDGAACQRVLVCSAQGTDPFTLVQWLADHNGHKLVRRRFSGSHPPDVATDYMDMMEGDRVLRVIAMARNGLLLGITRALLPDYSHVVLLFSGHEARDQDLFHRALQACEGIVHPPNFISLGLDAAANQPLFSAARRLGVIYLDGGLGPTHEPAPVWHAVQPLLAQYRQSGQSSRP